MKQFLILSALIFFGLALSAQTASTVKGSVTDAKTGKPVADADVTIQETGTVAKTDAAGAFALIFEANGNYTLVVEKDGYLPINMTFKLNAGAEADLGEILLPVVVSNEESIIELSDFEIENADEISTEPISGILHGSRDLFLSTAGYTFGSLRFRVRGYDNEYQALYLNGIMINDMESENPIWSLWGGLNDATRNTERYNGVHANDFGFGNVGGATNVNMRASGLRKQTRVSYAYSNRTYTNRAMFIHSTGLMKNGWAVSVSGSRRVSLDGVANGLFESYVDGTFDDSWAYFASVEKKFNNHHSIGLVGFGSPSKRGRTVNTLQEVYDLTGNNYYNPNWGWQDGRKRNARIATSHKPTGVLTHFWTIDKNTTINTSAAYTQGHYSTTGLSFYNALDPRPDYYRYLPSYDGLSEDAIAAYTDIFQSGQGQIDWDNLYRTNLNTIDVAKNPNGAEGTELEGYISEYILENQHNDEKQFFFNSTLNTKLDGNVKLTAGVTHRNYLGSHYKTMEDLLGGDFIVDIDKFALAENAGSGTEVIQLTDADARYPNRIIYEGDRFGYDYDAHVQYTEVWAQLDMTYNRWDLYTAAKGTYTNFWRTGNMLKPAYPDNSLGDSEKHTFANSSLKGGAVFKINGRNFIRMNAMFETKAPDFRDSYLSSRTRNDVIPNLESEFVSTADAGYVLRAPRFKASVDVFYTKFENRSSTRGFYHDGYASFVNYTITGIDQTHQGAEIASEVTLFPGFTLQAVASLGYYRWTSTPSFTTIIDNSAEELDKGLVFADGYLVDGTPQTALSGGFQYWAPKYWNIGANVSYTQDRYLAFNPVRLTPYAVQNMEIGSEEYNKVVRQELLNPAFVVDVSAGKSFQIKKKYNLAININVSNVLDNKEIITGGYDQFRYDIAAPDKFPAKYYYYFGRTYFASLTFRF